MDVQLIATQTFYLIKKNYLLKKVFPMTALVEAFFPVIIIAFMLNQFNQSANPPTSQVCVSMCVCVCVCVWKFVWMCVCVCVRVVCVVYACNRT